MLIYTILITSSLFHSEGSKSAFLFSNALMKKKNHFINNIFFYSHGALNGTNMMSSKINGINLVHEWYKFSKKFLITLNICSNSAQERGIISDEIAKELGFINGNLHSGFQLVGLGKLIKTMLKSDRLLQF
ncbi:sulfurtransferase complex subunit TusD [Buchnera aphidicola]|uniref:Sulfurtransferase complex subunit TusD n=1 Tax=Buchnera aphidicola (Therioaphis trifolii) TaxID=1241884 RepID=A0A4D6YN25_9GAMM|nr:sulfurtransferase complex subunit TusD [Buchnera aphidicola]QCI27344.1 sulfurtransferase complex subunit TusD [Buchnera aphidicola (Therioaphis trifolii)]